MSVTLGNASISELGTINGTPGDQTKAEVCLRGWYSYPWGQMVRAKDPDVAEKIASAMEAACANDHIGYGQKDRLTLNAEAKKVGYDLSKISTDCNCDCSSLVAVCAIAAGVPVSPSIYTGNEVSALQKTGQFDVYTGAEYLTSDKLMKRGDILVKQYAHTVVVLSDGEDAMPEPDDGIRYIDTDELNIREYANMDGQILAKCPFQAPVGLLAVEGDWARVRVEGYVASAYLSKHKPKLTYTTTDNLNLRATPGVDGKLIVTMPKGATVQATGDTEKVDGILWRQVIYNGRSGWASGDYLA